mmetsp:Transcript_22110/g.50584  ORF Transcript_22110/g.50584 Transcript_22110/m.50584 type:complete len:175 (+) Transcript_22110:51-575(+)
MLIMGSLRMLLLWLLPACGLALQHVLAQLLELRKAETTTTTLAPAPAPGPAPQPKSSLNMSAGNFYTSTVRTQATTTTTICPCATTTGSLAPYTNTTADPSMVLDVATDTIDPEVHEVAAQDCIPSSWSDWSYCVDVPDDNLRQKFSYRHRVISQPRTGNGIDCPDLRETSSCS